MSVANFLDACYFSNGKPYYTQKQLIKPISIISNATCFGLMILMKVEDLLNGDRYYTYQWVSCNRKKSVRLNIMGNEIDINVRNSNLYYTNFSKKVLTATM